MNNLELFTVASNVSNKESGIVSLRKCSRLRLECEQELKRQKMGEANKKSGSQTYHEKDVNVLT